MTGLWAEFLKAVFLLLPAYIANMIPVFSGGKTPIDFGQKLYRHRILGPGKTIRGFVYGVAAGTIIGSIEWLLLPFLNDYASSFGFVFPKMNLFIAFLISFGSLAGDATGSFIKRRMNLERGKEVLGLDQLNFIIGAIVFSFFFTQISWEMIAVMILITPIVHRTACIIGYWIKVKREPW